MFAKIAIATATLATAAMMSAAPAAAGAGIHYGLGNDRITVEIGYGNYNNNRYGGNRRSGSSAYSDYRPYRHYAHLTPLQRHRRILRNSGGMRAWKVKRHLRNRGFYRIRITDNLLPIYKFRACRHGKRFTISTNRFGDIRWKNRIGRCHGFRG